MELRTPRGTHDILPEEARLWRRFEQTAARVMENYGFGEIRTPIFEHTELFVRSVGETSDIVEKQMYTFEDQGGRSITLRPEGTAPVVRSFVQHKMDGGALPQKLWYIQPMFRYERPQLGRGRQFHQFGAEMIGSMDPACDFEIIAAGVELYGRLGIHDYDILINSIGCTRCRPAYRQELISFLKERMVDLCKDCVSRYERNPLRVLDCKNEGCRKATADAPTMTRHLCDECETHFDHVKQLLTAGHIPFTIDERLVRGLDYYSKTVFEFVTSRLGSQGTILAGGRYDGLVSELGGKELPAVGFGAGIERAVAMLQSGNDTSNALTEPTDVFVVMLGAEPRKAGIELTTALRREGINAVWDYGEGVTFNKSLRAQMKRADRSGAKIALVLGEDELERGVVAMRLMDTRGEQIEVGTDQVISKVKEALEFEAKEGHAQ